MILHFPIILAIIDGISYSNRINICVAEFSFFTIFHTTGVGENIYECGLIKFIFKIVREW